jgi:hypothetical protein
VTFAREKRLLLGVAALLAPLPLPFNDVLEWPALGLFLAVVANFLRRAAQRSESWLSHRALNLLGLAYLPLLVVDVAASGRVQFVRPILHLILFSLAAKLWSLEREKDKWQVWVGIFFLFLAAMSTSTHPAVLVYLVAFVALAVLLLARFVHLHVLSSHSPRGAAAPRLPLGALAAGVVLAALAFAVPLFALMPRVRTPMVGGPSGFGGQQTLPQAGFSDEMSLDLIGRIRDNPAIALRLRFSGRTPDPSAMRFKAAAYDVWEGRSWRLAAGGRWVERRRGAGDSLRLGSGAAVGRVDVELEPLQSRHLVLPLEAIEVELGGRRVARDAAGTLSLGALPTSRVAYAALLGALPLSHADPPGFDAEDGGPLDVRGIDERLRALAVEWTAGAAGDRQRAERLVARFHRDFAYTTVFLGRGGDDPIATFLYDTRRGHCEYFASSLVLLLRALGTPARLVTGFYGAEWSGWEDAWIVRQSYAHAWVEAWIEGEGWQVFDPTPPAGLPAVPERDLRLWAQQAWEAALLRWDRWVISYDFEDQVSVLGGLRAAWDDLWARLFAGGERGRGRTPEAVATARAESRAAAEVSAVRRRVATAIGLALAFAAAAASAYWLRRRARWDATLAYLGLRRALAAAGLAVPDSLPPLAVARAGARRLPAAAAAIEALVSSYLAEAFAGRALGAELTGALRDDLRAVEAAARRAEPPRRGPT